MGAYQILLTIQIIALIVGVFGLFSMFRSMFRPEAKYLLGASATTVIFGLGYLLEMRSTDLGMAYYAICLQYVGLSYIPMLFACYLDKYTNAVKIPNYVWNILSFYETLNLVLVLTARHHTFYYKSLSFTQEGLFPHLIEEPTILLNIFMFHIAGLAVLCCFIAIRAIRQSRYKKRRTAFTGVLLASASAVIAMLLSVSVGFVGYEPISAIILLAIGIIAIVRTAGRTLDPVEIAYAGYLQRTKAALVVVNENYGLLSCNDAAYKVFRGLEAKDPGEIFSYAEEIVNATDKKETIQIEDRFYYPYYYPIGDERKKMGFLMALVDVTEAEKQAREFADLKKAAEEASQAKSIFLANMSHEMRTPLNAVIGLTELAQRETNAKSIKEYLPQILNSAQMLLDIVSDVLDFSKAESGKMEIVPVEYDLREVINTVTNMTNIRIGDKNVDLLVDVDPTIPGRLIGDDARVRQIMVNFLTNAAKYTDSGFVRFKIDHQKIGEMEIMLEIMVEDTGRGIKKDEIGNLFTVFNRVDLKNNRNIQGTGLGLAICGQLITLMDGSYHVESEYGKGSKFFFEIPQKVAHDTPLSESERTEFKLERNVPFHLYQKAGDLPDDVKNANRREEKLKEACEGMRVMIVDDNNVNLRVIASMLKVYGIPADCVLSGQEAVDMLATKEYDVIFMDHMMPEMDGIEAAKLIRAQDTPWSKRVQIIACTANAIKGAGELFLRNGHDDYICKPIKMSELQKTLAACVDRMEKRR
ncbi:MAG: response regulator [Lachnospiraceae bacterium]|nr:response regulator [Lachnospiraceae bacterium]